jgi:hypothetical protein
MKRTTIFVPEALERDLQLYARREGKPTAAVVREALAAYIAQKGTAQALPSFAAAFDSGHSDTADQHEEILFKRLSPHEVARRGRRTPKPTRRSKPR